MIRRLMIESDTFQQLRRQFDTASWAIWSEGFPRSGCLEYDSDDLVEHLFGKIERFKPWIVLLGLNRSTDEVDNFGNFHSPSFRNSDYVLRISVEESGLEGAYMTDVTEDIAATASDVEMDNEAKNRLLDQMELLSQNHYYIVCFGAHVYREVKELFSGEERPLNEDIAKYSTMENDTMIDFYSVYHYSQRIGENTEKHRKQLSYLAGNQIPIETDSVHS